MAANDDGIKVKKISPYPFDIIVERKEEKGKVEALKLVLHGLLVDMKSMILNVGETINMQLLLPADYGVIVTEGKVVKTYDHFKGSQQGTTARRIAEIHFVRQPLPERDRLKAKEFLKAIKQTGNFNQ